MSAGLLESDAMFYAKEGGVPWHGVGVSVEEAPTSDAAMEVAKLDWTVMLRPAYYSVQGKGSYKRAADFQIMVRSDTGYALGTCGLSYSPIQNKEMFRFLDALVANGDLRYETAGSLWNGRRVWMLARIPTELEIGGDRMFPYLLAASAHDGSGACKVLPTLVRVVCANTLHAAVFSRDDEVRQMTVNIRHTGRVLDKLGQARQILGLGMESFKRLKTAGDLLAATDGLPHVEGLLSALFPAKKGDEEKKLSKDIEESRDKFRLIVEAEARRGSGKPTGWDLVNAVTGYADHVRAPENVRGGRFNTKEEAVVDSIFFKGASEFRQRGLDLVLGMTGVYEKLDELKVPVRLKRAS